MSDHVRRKIERDVLVALAGTAAQRIFNARSVRWWHGENDRSVAQELLAYIAPDMEELIAYLQLLEIRTRLHLQHFLTWPAVEVLAQALLVRETLSGHEARRIIREAREQVLDD